MADVFWVFPGSRSANQRNANEAYNHHRQDEKEKKSVLGFSPFEKEERSAERDGRKEIARETKTSTKQNENEHEGGGGGRATFQSITLPTLETKDSERMRTSLSTKHRPGNEDLTRYAGKNHCLMLLWRHPSCSSSVGRSVLVLLLAH